MILTETDTEREMNDKLPMQGLSQDLETGCQKLTVVKFWGILFFQGRQQYTEITTTNMYLLVKTRHTINIQCRGNYTDVEKLIPNKFGCPEG